MIRRAFSDGASETRLHAHPAVAVFEFRLIQNFEENFFGIERRVVFCERAPIILELFDEAVIAREFLLEVAFGMDVDDDVEILIEDHFYGGVHHCQIFRGDAIGLAAAKHRIAIQRKANVVEAHRFDEGNILRGVVGVEVFLCVALRIEDLGEPMAEIDAVSQMLCALEGERGVLRKNCRSSRQQDENRDDRTNRREISPSSDSGRNDGH